MPFDIIHGDITEMDTDAIVNAVDYALVNRGRGVCTQIFRKAGDEEMRRACEAVSPCAVGSCVVTEGFRLKARYVIHAVGPVWQGGSAREGELLYSAYRSALRAAENLSCQSIAFPLLSSGNFHFPREKALQIAQQAIQDFLRDSDMQVYLVLYFGEHLREDGPGRIEEMENYLQVARMMTAPPPQMNRAFPRGEASFCVCSELPKAKSARGRVKRKAAEVCESAPVCGAPPAENLKDMLEKLDAGFVQTVNEIIFRRWLNPTEVYKAANLDRKLFSKMMSSQDYRPKKETAVALAIGLKLNLEETNDLLSRAGYTLSNASKGDIIVMYYIATENWNVHEINMTLFDYDQKLLGNCG